MRHSYYHPLDQTYQKLDKSHGLDQTYQLRHLLGPRDKPLRKAHTEYRHLNSPTSQHGYRLIEEYAHPLILENGSLRHLDPQPSPTSDSTCREQPPFQVGLPQAFP